MFDRPLILRLLCVALVAAVMLPLGRMVFPYLGDDISGIQFHALEAVLSTTLGFGIFSVFG